MLEYLKGFYNPVEVDDDVGVCAGGLVCLWVGMCVGVSGCFFTTLSTFFSFSNTYFLPHIVSKRFVIQR